MLPGGLDFPLIAVERQTHYHATQADGAEAAHEARRPAQCPQRWRDAVAELVELQAGYQPCGSTPCRRALRTTVEAHRAPWISHQRPAANEH